MNNTINELMDRLAEEYTNEDIDTIIDYTRKQLAMYNSGGKPKKEKQEETKAETQEVFAKMMEKFKATQPTLKIKRRI